MAARIHMKTVIKGHICAFKFKQMLFFFFFADHMAKEPVEDTDPSTLSFNGVGTNFTVMVMASYLSFVMALCFLLLSIYRKMGKPKIRF